MKTAIRTIAMILILTICTTFTGLTLSPYDEFMEQLPVTVRLNGDLLDIQTVTVEDRTLVPFRPIMESLGAAVTYDDSTGMISAEREQSKVSFGIGDTTISYTDKEGDHQMDIDVPAVVLDGVTFVPIRFALDVFDVSVMWEYQKKQVDLYDFYTFAQQLKAVAPSLYAFLDTPMIKTENGIIHSTNEILCKLELKDKDNMDSSYKLDYEENTVIKNGKLQSDIVFNVEQKSLIDLFGYFADVLNMDVEKLRNISVSLLADKDALYLKTNIFDAFDKSPFDKERIKDIWLKFDYNQLFGINMDSILGITRDGETTMLDLMSQSGKFFPSIKYFPYNMILGNINYKQLLVYAKYLFNEDTFRYAKSDNENYMLSWSPNGAQFDAAAIEYHTWEKRYNYRYSYSSYNKTPTFELTQAEVDRYTGSTTNIDVSLNVSDSRIDTLSVGLNTQHEKWGEVDTIFSLKVNTTGKPNTSGEEIYMPNDRNTLPITAFQGMYDFPFGTLPPAIGSTYYWYNNYNYFPEDNPNGYPYYYYY